MPDTLANDDIAQMIEDVHAHSAIVNGVKRTTVTTDALLLVLRELLAARAERDSLRKTLEAAEARDPSSDMERAYHVGE